MITEGSFGVAAGAVALGAVHGIEPGHGWPVAASYALDQTNKWLYGFAASLIIGIGHLVSSITMVGVFFYAKDYFNLTQINEPVTVLGGIEVGGPVSLVAGVLLVVLGIREYRHGHTHGDQGSTHGEPDGGHESGSPDHGHSDHAHDRSDHDSTADSGHSHGHGGLVEGADRGLVGIAWFAFVLGFAHEEEFEIIALCAGSNYCLELMTVYALTVIAGIVGLTMLLIAGYHRYEERVRQYTPYLPVFSAAVLSLMGVGFILGIL